MGKRKIDVSTILVIIIGFLCVLFTISSIHTIKKDNYYDKILQDYVIIEENKDTYDMLVYDKETYIVYKCKLDRDGYGLFNDDYIIEPYFSSNGLPYRYNLDNKNIEQIRQERN